DGDTLVLTNGERVRLLGINTPEVNFNHPEKSQPLAIAARARLQELIPDGSKVRLVIDHRERDRYKRLLAFVRFADDQDAGKILLEQGLAWQYLILPNQLCWQQYRDAESKAFKATEGVWDDSHYPSTFAKTVTIGKKKRNYQRVKGTITGTEHSSKNYWYLLDNRVWFGIAKKDTKHFTDQLERLKIGTSIQVSGWMYQSYGKIRIKARHPQALRFL
ncbi:MAG: hypothetical protein DRQ47_06650, partial [Gammaproteobacteria bacterium]